MVIAKNTVYNINYTKTDGSVSAKKIISMTDLPANITTLDVTELSDDDILLLSTQLNDYKEYIDGLLVNAYDFKTWYEHTQNKVLHEKFQKIRKLTVSKITHV